MELSEALMQHMDWKVRLRAALASHQTLDVASAADHCSCTFGIWLNGEAKARFGHLDSYRDCIEKHAHFHQQAGRVVQCIGEGNDTEAKSMLGMAGSFSVASSALIESLKRLRQESEKRT